MFPFSSYCTVNRLVAKPEGRIFVKPRLQCEGACDRDTKAWDKEAKKTLGLKGRILLRSFFPQYIEAL